MKILAKFEENLHMGPGVLRIAKVFITMAFLAHLHACVFFYLGYEDETGYSWLKNYCPPAWDKCLYEMPLQQQYLASIYWSFTTMTTVGYGDVTPDKRSIKEMVWTVCTQLVGATVFAYNISSMVELFSSLDLAAKVKKQKLAAFGEFITSLSWGPKGAKRYKFLERVNQHYRHALNTKSVFPEEAFYDTLPPFLRKQVIRYVYRDLITALPNVGRLDEAYRGAWTLILPKLRTVAFMPGEEIITVNSMVREAYFVIHGKCKATANDDKDVVELRPGDAFAEVSCLLQKGE